MTAQRYFVNIAADGNESFRDAKTLGLPDEYMTVTVFDTETDTLVWGESLSQPWNESGRGARTEADRLLRAAGWRRTDKWLDKDPGWIAQALSAK